MKYYWDSNNLRQDVKLLEKMFEEEKDIRKREELLYYIAEAKSLVLEEEAPTVEEDSDYFNAMSNLVPLFEPYYSYIDEYRRTLDKYIDEMIVDEPSKRKLYLKKDELLELVAEFYKSVGGYLYPHFDKLFKNRHNSIRFQREGLEYATTIIVPGLNKPYMTVESPKPTNYRNTLSMLVHELGHGISAQICPERYLRDDSFLKEIETTFLEFVSNDFFAKELNDDAFYEDELERLVGGHSAAEDILLSKRVVDLRYELGNPSKEKMLKIIDDAILKSTIETKGELGLDEDIRYLFSYIIAIELYEIYLKDKKAALEILKEIIIRKDNETEIQNVLRLVTPNKSLIKFKNHMLKK